MIQTVSPAQLAAYFNRIGYAGSHEANGDTLRALHRLHPQAIPFENIDTLAGITPRLDLDAVFAKLVSNKRGGYCYEHNLLFRAVLAAIGFETTGLAARVLWADPDAMLPRTHMMLLVETPDETWLADVGFGSMTLTAPLVFENGLEQATPHETFRLDLVEHGDFKLLVRLGDQWKPMYRFDLEPQVPSDYAMANHYVSTHADSVFVRHLIVGRVTPGQRRNLFDHTLTTRRPDGEEHREIASAGQLRRVLQDDFDLVLPADAGIDNMLERVLTQAAFTPN